MVRAPRSGRVPASLCPRAAQPVALRPSCLGKWETQSFGRLPLPAAEEPLAEAESRPWEGSSGLQDSHGAAASPVCGGRMGGRQGWSSC